MIYDNIHQGVFLRRPNRFLAHVVIDGREVVAHVKNTGRCGELLIPGTEVWCTYHDDPQRKTRWSLITVRKGDTLFNIDSQVPNRLAGEWMQQGGLGVAVERQKAEHRYGDARLDWYFVAGGRPCLLEVKGVTLEQDGVARFPDAPTERGTKHVHHLRQAVGEGYGAYILFVCQMAGILRVEPNIDRDPAFAQALWSAREAGVQLLAVECDVTPDSITAARPVPVVLPSQCSSL
ncbi:DNA/RNA nuclease SfsA [Candidatus Avoscillospira sp. LCP25S3_F1]|uniref:DNA/RNA nuclease SfsA n=1 Tax=Candidatus Avoscillospira sp. LCP25S3_F1 TaxID=3438825 RepID=UPI003F8E6125